MKKYLKKSQITNLLVLPLIASAIFLANPVFASSTAGGIGMEVRNITSQDNAENLSNPKKGIVGTVVSINGDILVVTTKNDVQYNVNASHATIMKAGDGEDSNPNIITTGDIKVGDAILVRGKVNYDTE